MCTVGKRLKVAKQLSTKESCQSSMKSCMTVVDSFMLILFNVIVVWLLCVMNSFMLILFNVIIFTEENQAVFHTVML